jgi:hypothetical protein
VILRFPFHIGSASSRKIPLRPVEMISLMVVLVKLSEFECNRGDERKKR